MKRALGERMAANILVDPETGCHLWQLRLNANGYGVIGSVGPMRKSALAHRLAFELAYGAIPEGLVIDHLCRTRACCNPLHMEAVTQRENTLRGHGPAAIAARTTACPRGHPYDEVNTVRSGGRRKCRICRTVQSRVDSQNRRDRLASIVRSGKTS